MALAPVDAATAALADDSTWDVVVVGGGINGASAFATLATAGYRTLLVDAGDFATGTSQASAMLIWGGLLYLANYEVGAVLSLSRARDRLIAEQRDRVHAHQVLYVPGSNPRALGTVHAGLVAYWALSGFRRARPTRVRTFPERAWLRRPSDGLVYEEASVAVSDARFVVDIVGDGEHAGGTARNHCRVVEARHDRALGRWILTLDDARSGPRVVRSRAVVNSAGGWTDDVNAIAGVETPFRHALSRGVSLVVPRMDGLTRHVVVDEGADGPMTLGPWGPVAVWGSTDTMHPTMAEAAVPGVADVRHLLSRYAAVLTTPLPAPDVVALRCGVRPLAVRRVDDPRLDDGPSLSRHSRLHLDAPRAWLSVYGGKLSGAVRLADAVLRRMAGCLGSPVRPLQAVVTRAVASPTVAFPGLDVPMVAPAWAATHEHCRSLDDYLRRRTNIAQWVPRGGFGRRDEHRAAIVALGQSLHAGDAPAAAADLAAYSARVARDAAILDAAAASMSGVSA